MNSEYRLSLTGCGGILTVWRDYFGIVLGLFVGKQGGFLLATWLAVRSGKGEMPEGFRWLHFWGVSCLAGIGFTMSLFVSELAFKSESLLANAKIAILAGSIVSACVGYGILHAVLPKDSPSEEPV